MYPKSFSRARGENTPQTHFSAEIEEQPKTPDFGPPDLRETTNKIFFHSLAAPRPGVKSNVDHHMNAFSPGGGDADFGDPALINLFILGGFLGKSSAYAGKKLFGRNFWVAQNFVFPRFVFPGGETRSYGGNHGIMFFLKSGTGVSVLPSISAERILWGVFLRAAREKNL